MNIPAHANDNAARPPEESRLAHLDRMQEAVHNAYQERPAPVRVQVDAVMCQVCDWASIAAKDAHLYHVADSPKANAALNQLAGELELNAMRIGEALLGRGRCPLRRRLLSVRVRSGIQTGHRGAGTGLCPQPAGTGSKRPVPGQECVAAADTGTPDDGNPIRPRRRQENRRQRTARLHRSHQANRITRQHRQRQGTAKRYEQRTPERL